MDCLFAMNKHVLYFEHIESLMCFLPNIRFPQAITEDMPETFSNAQKNVIFPQKFVDN